MQTDAKTFADMFPYPICNLCAVSLLYFTICQRLTKFMTSTSLSAEHNKKSRQACLNAIFYCVLQRPAAGGEGCAKSRSDCANPESDGCTCCASFGLLYCKGPAASDEGCAKSRSGCANPESEIWLPNIPTIQVCRGMT